MLATATTLPFDVVEAIRGFFPRYPDRRAVVLPAMHAIQERLGYVPPWAVRELGALLEIAPAEIQDAISFYGFFRQDGPLGRTRIQVCRCVACSARDGEVLLDQLCRKLEIRPGETTRDGLVTVEYAECLGACDAAPAMLVGDELCGDMTPEKVDELVESMRRNAPGTPKE
jgi:NADH-quinone oxidoreductase subunit E